MKQKIIFSVILILFTLSIYSQNKKSEKLGHAVILNKHESSNIDKDVDIKNNGQWTNKLETSKANNSTQRAMIIVKCESTSIDDGVDIKNNGEYGIGEWTSELEPSKASNSTFTMEVQIYNDGNINLEITKFDKYCSDQVGCSNFKWTNVSSDDIEPGGKSTFTVTYEKHSTSSSTQQAKFKIFSNAFNGKTFVLHINTKEQSRIDWDKPDPIEYRTELTSDDHLNASLSNAGWLSGYFGGDFSYSLEIGTVLNAGDDQELNVIFEPWNQDDYTIAFKRVYIDVTKVPTELVWEDPQSGIVYGEPLSSLELTAEAFTNSDNIDPKETVDGRFEYSPKHGELLDAGAHDVDVTFIPASDNYEEATTTATVTVGKATPIIEWPPLSDMGYGEELTDLQLNATANVEGTLTYSPPLGTILAMGTNDLTVDFTPTDGDNYNTESKTVQVEVGTTMKPKLQAHRIIVDIKKGYDFSRIYGNKFTVYWQRGEGVACAVFVREDTLGLAEAVDGTVHYTPNPIFGQGDQIGTSGWYCVYDGTDTIVTVTGLTVDTDYKIMVLEYAEYNSYKSYLTHESVYNPRVVTTLESIEKNIVSANIITANGDGINDHWQVERIEELQGYELTIFNNIGEPVYNAENYDNTWDATYNGEQLPSGTYYYIFQKESSIIKGFITIVK